MAEQVVTQLIVDASGAKSGVAEFQAAMAKAKAAAVDGGSATATSFENAQRRWVQSLGTTDPVIKAQIAMETALAKQRDINTRAVQLGITTQDAAAAQLEKVTQKHQANIQAIREQTGQLALGERAMVGFRNATSGVSGQLIAMSAGAGPVGVFLGALGPWGIAAAVGLGALAAAFNYVREEAARMGQKAIDLRQFADVTGLTTGQISALRRSAGELGVSGDTVATSFERLTSNLTEARRAGGQLYDNVRLIDVGLADQLRQSTTTAQGIDAIAKAYHDAGDEAQRASIARAAFGRGGAALGPVLDTIAQAGGIDAIAQATQRLNDATSDQTRRWAQMQAQIDATNSRAKNILASIFTEQGLQASLAAAQYMERAAIAAKELAAQKDGLTWWQSVMADWAHAGATARGADPTEALAAFMTAAANRKNDLGREADHGAAFRKLATDVEAATAAFEKNRAAALSSADALKQAQDAAAGEAKLMRDLVGALGSAATIEEQRIARQKDLNSAWLDNKFGASQSAEAIALYNRAVAANNLDASIKQHQALLGVLGPLANLQQQLQGAEDRIAQVRQQGVTVTKAQADAIKNLVVAQYEWGRVNQQSAIGIFNLGDATRAAGHELQSWIDQKLLDPANANQMAAAQQALADKIKAAADQAALASSPFKQLKQLQLDAGDLNKQLDTLATGGLNNFNNALLDFQTGAKSGKDAIADLEKQTIRSLLNMMNQMIIIQPLAKALQGLLGGGFSFGGLGGNYNAGLAGGSGAVTSGGFVVGGNHAGGIAGVEATFHRYVHPAYFDDAPRYHTGGIAGDNEVPIIAQRGEGIFTTAQMKALGGSMKPTVVAPRIYNYGADVQTQTGDDGQLEITVRAITRDELSSGRTNPIFGQKYGTRPALKAR